MSSRFLTFASSLELFCGTVSTFGHFVVLFTDSTGEDLSLQYSTEAQCDGSVTDDSSEASLWHVAVLLAHSSFTSMPPSHNSLQQTYNNTVHFTLSFHSTRTAHFNSLSTFFGQGCPKLRQKPPEARLPATQAANPYVADPGMAYTPHCLPHLILSVLSWD